MTPKPPDLSLEEYAKWYRQAGVPELRQILYWCWDPIAVNDGFPYNSDEYESYVPELLGKLRRGADAAEVGGFLRRVENGDMDMELRLPEELAAISERIVTWHRQSMAHWIEFTARRVTPGRARR